MDIILLLLNRMEKKSLWVSSLYQLSLMLFFWLVEIFIMEMEGGWHDSTAALLKFWLKCLVYGFIDVICKSNKLLEKKSVKIKALWIQLWSYFQIFR